ncbi:Hsp33 family molecular chaperone HslO, partial [Rhizobium brockwellii]|uniref:Hsp33 family molecular chaperone HslO n=1 Tax=Rhizobium brockwellii TaxID=3019932 RepID=UPI003F94ED02
VGDTVSRPNGVDDDWIEARSLVESIDADELTYPLVGTERLLFRLLHERGVRVYEPRAVFDRFSCSRYKIKGVLKCFCDE